MTYQTDETISLTKVADSNLPKEESSSRRKWLAAVAAVLIGGGGTMVVSSLSSSNVNPVISSEISLDKGIVRGGETQTCLGWTEAPADWCWELIDGNGLWCPDWSASGRESGSVQGLGDQGWDPCCYDITDCNGMGNIFEAVFDKNANKWCMYQDFLAGGGACLGNFWTGGFVYDTCPCGGDDWYNCEGGKKQKCVPYFGEGGEKKTDYEGMCGDAVDVCYEGFINAPYANGKCLNGHRLSEDYNKVPECIPE